MMTIQTKWLLAAAGIATVAGTGTWFYSTAASPDQIDTAAELGTVEISERSTTSAPGARARGCNFTPGVQLAYSLFTEDRAELDLSGLGANIQSQASSEVRSTTRARLEMRAISNDPEWGSILLARYAEFDANTIVEDDKLQAPFMVRIASDCSVDGFAHQRELDAGYARVQQALLHELSWMWPAEEEGQFEARNTYGSFIATVDQSETNDEVALTQGITSVESWVAGPGSVERVTDSHQQVVPGQVAWFETLEARASFEGPRSQVEHVTRATYVDNNASSLNDVSTDESDYLWADLLPHDIPLNERQPPTESELLALARARELTVDQAVEQYVALAQNEDVGIQDTWPPLRTYLEARPEAAEEVIERVRRGEMPSGTIMGAYIALGNARTPQARQALEGVMRDETAPVIERSRAVLSLIDRSDVGMELANYLAQQSSALVSGETQGARVMARQSLLALGAMSGRKSHDQEIQQAALRQLTTLLAETRDKGVAYQRPVFGALANVGDIESLQMVAHIPDHPDPDVREAAAIVFRRMPPQESADFAARWLAQETNPNVKRALWHTIELQTFDAREMTSREVVEFALRDLRERPGFITRKALIRLLARAIEEMPKDELGIEEAFIELIPFEFEQDSGFHRMMHDHIDPERREEIYLEVARGFETDSSTADTPTTIPEPSDDDMTHGGGPGSGIPVIGERDQ